MSNKKSSEVNSSPSPRLERAVDANARGCHTLAPSRGLFIAIHRYVGLLMASFLIVAGLSGSLLVFYDPLDGFFAAELHHAPRPAPDAPLMNPFEWKAVVDARLPEGLTTGRIPLDMKHGEAVSVFVGVPGALRGKVDNNFFFSPYTGELIGSRTWGELGQGTKNLMPFLYRLHHSLALGTVGSLLLGIVALLWTLDCFVGAYLTMPKKGSVADVRQRKSWLVRWKPSWLIKGNRLFTSVFTFHRASGLWIWAMLFVIAWSGVGLNLNSVYKPAQAASSWPSTRRSASRATTPRRAGSRACTLATSTPSGCPFASSCA